jgi:hypothetical protein
MEAGQTNPGDLILWQQQLWSVASKGVHGDVAITSTDPGGCIRVEHLAEHEDVEDAGIRLANLRGELELERSKRERYSLTDGARLVRIGSLRAEIEWLEAQGVRGAVILGEGS